MNQECKINSPIKAIHMSEQLTGLGEMAKNIIISPVIISGANVPFLSKKVEQKNGWLVEYHGVSLKLISAQNNEKDSYIHDFKVILDEYGQLISISSVFSGNDPNLKILPSVHSAEEQMKNEEEIWFDFIGKIPKETFVNALDIIKIKGIGNPYSAKEIYAVYILHSSMESKPKAVWSITLRGIPPISARGPAGDSIPIWQRNHMRNVIDAETGEFLFATNSPQPDIE